MNAPDKIYLNIPKQELEAPLDSTTWDTKEFDDCINVEYIRKDALLDWLKAVKADVMIPMNIDRVIAKIESL